MSDDETVPASELLKAALYEIDHQLHRVRWNYADAEYETVDDVPSPFNNSGGGHYSNAVFSVAPYDWGWDCDSSCRPQPSNFQWRSVTVWWYKHARRCVRVNREVPPEEVSRLLEECLRSLWEWEEELRRSEEAEDAG